MKISQQHDGFTILELLIAATITILVVVMLGTMFTSLGTTASRANQRTDTFRDARAALQMMARDFSNLVKVQSAPYFVIDGDAAGNDVRQLNGLVSLKNAPSNGAQAGDVCAIRYYCSWNNNAYSLRRYFRDSALTLQTFQSFLSGNPATLSYVTCGCLLDSSRSSPNSLYLGDNPVDEVLASYVWNLRVIAYDSNGNLINQVNDAFGKPTSAPYVCDPNGSSNLLPAAIEVSFNAISPEAARSLLAATASRSDGYAVWMVAGTPTPSSSDKELFDNLILPNMYTFRTRLTLH